MLRAHDVCSNLLCAIAIRTLCVVGLVVRYAYLEYKYSDACKVVSYRIKETVPEAISVDGDFPTTAQRLNAVLLEYSVMYSVYKNTEHIDELSSQLLLSEDDVLYVYTGIPEDLCEVLYGARTLKHCVDSNGNLSANISSYDLGTELSVLLSILKYFVGFCVIGIILLCACIFITWRE